MKAAIGPQEDTRSAFLTRGGGDLVDVRVARGARGLFGWIRLLPWREPAMAAIGMAVGGRFYIEAIGSSILVGIASTKFIGVLVLAFAPSTMFKLYYFRMYLFIIFIGCFNGLMFLPLVLRWFGPMPDISDIKEKEEMRR